LALRWLDSDQRFSNAEYEFPYVVGQDVYELPFSYIVGFKHILVFWKGMHARDVEHYTEEDSTHIRIVPDQMEAGDPVTVVRIPNEFSLGDIKVVNDQSSLNLLPTTFGEVALVVTERKFYINKGPVQGWEEFIIPFTTQNVGLVFTFDQVIVTDPTVHTVSLAKHYPLGSDSILVFVDDRLQQPDTYVEIDSQTIQFINDLEFDSGYLVHTVEVVIANQDSWDELNPHSRTWEYDEDQDVRFEKLYFMGNLISTIEHQYDGNGLVLKIIVTKTNRVITKDYVNDVKGNPISEVVSIVNT